jgi:tripartite-type tricarboxylate transporter receptor subunit TctC
MTINRRSILTAAAGFAGAGLMPGFAFAQLGQGRTMTLMVPYPAGGLSDAIARNLQPALQKMLGQTVVVENLGGASGGLAAQKLLQTQADGRMIFQGSPNELILSPLVNPDIKFKPDQFRHVTQITQNPLILLARPDSPANTVDELIDYAKKLGKPAPYGSVGVGSLYHILSEELAKQAGFKVTHIPYRGAAPMFQDLASGQVEFAILPYATSYKGLQEQKKLKMLGWVSKTRNPFIPELASLGESKALPNFDHSIWAGIFVRRDTPEDIVRKINAAMADMMKTPEVRTAVGNTGSIVIDTTSLEVAQKFYEDQVKTLDAMTKDINFKV